LDYGELDHAQEVHGQFLVSGRDAAAALEAADAAFHQVAASIQLAIQFQLTLI
jgi:hypothetical protein